MCLASLRGQGFAVSTMSTDGSHSDRADQRVVAVLGIPRSADDLQTNRKGQGVAKSVQDGTKRDQKGQDGTKTTELQNRGVPVRVLPGLSKPRQLGAASSCPTGSVTSRSVRLAWRASLTHRFESCRACYDKGRAICAAFVVLAPAGIALTVGSAAVAHSPPLDESSRAGTGGDPPGHRRSKARITAALPIPVTASHLIPTFQFRTFAKLTK
jgi:hypothetical protein